MRAPSLEKARAKATRSNMSSDNKEGLNNWHWDTLITEECDKPHDDLHHSIYAHEQHQFNY
jgi:hypothetical protein